MTYQGMDTEAIGAVADRVTTQADVLDHVVEAVDASVRAAIHVWPGGDADDFHAWWVNQHRPVLLAVAAATRSAAVLLRNQVAHQVDASGGEAAGGARPSSWDPIGAGLVGSGITAALAGESIVDGLIGLSPAAGAGMSRWSRWALKSGHISLGAMGATLDAISLAEGVREHDEGKALTGGVGLGLNAMPPQLQIAGTAALLYGELTLPTSNEEYAGTYDMALHQRFGDAYDPASPTSDQAAWGQQRYSGFMGFLNSVSDGMDYKIGRWFPWNQH